MPPGFIFFYFYFYFFLFFFFFLNLVYIFWLQIALLTLTFITLLKQQRANGLVSLCPSPTEAGGTTVYPGASRVIPVHGPGWTGWNDVFLPNNLDGRPSRRSKTRGTPVHPGRAPAGPRFIPALTRFTPVLGPVLHGSPRSMPAEPRWRYGYSRFSTAELRSFPVHHGSSRRGENAV